jgi:hypothetical protein
MDRIGLPPTPPELQGLSPNAAPWAFEGMIDRLLDSAHCGERWAQPWLNVVRCAESEKLKNR